MIRSILHITKLGLAGMLAAVLILAIIACIVFVIKRLARVSVTAAVVLAIGVAIMFATSMHAVLANMTEIRAEAASIETQQRSEQIDALNSTLMVLKTRPKPA